MRRERERRIKDSDLLETVEEVFDVFTEQHLFYLYRKRILDRLYGVMSSGKEARVYWGKTPDGKDVAVKIYLTATAEFRKGITKYIMGDPRFERIPSKDFRKLIYEWTRKEFRNLKRLYNAGVNVPRPHGFKGNVIVMDFIGEKGRRASLLKEITAYLKENIDIARDIYRQTITNLELIVCNAKLVHADLSEFNIMYHTGKVYIIDVSQAVTLDHPLAIEFLERDIKNIKEFFTDILGSDQMDEEFITRVFSCV
jgi:RIO kinase 1